MTVMTRSTTREDRAAALVADWTRDIEMDGTLGYGHDAAMRKLAQFVQPELDSDDAWTLLWGSEEGRDRVRRRHVEYWAERVRSYLTDDPEGRALVEDALTEEDEERAADEEFEREWARKHPKEAA